MTDEPKSEPVSIATGETMGYCHLCDTFYNLTKGERCRCQDADKPILTIRLPKAPNA